jgi:beta-glucosidase
MVTAYHWDLPQALQDAGGWVSRDTAKRFGDYAAALAAELGDLVPLWVTLNEPWVCAFAGHLHGRHAPGLADLSAALRAAHHLLLGHGHACQALRAGRGSGQVGLSLNLSDVVPASDAPADAAAARRIDGHENRWFLDPLLRGHYPEDLCEWYAGRSDVAFGSSADLGLIRQPLDFLGINFYEFKRVAADAADDAHGARRLAPDGPVTHSGKAIEPAALTRVLRRVHESYGPLPLYLTENGACFNDYRDPEGNVSDYERSDYLAGYFEAAAEAIRRGVDLRGYYVWSLLDNFEWSYGYSQRFGLVYVDYPTQQRIPKHSAHWYRDLIAAQARR